MLLWYMSGTYRDDGRQSLYGPSAQSDVWQNVLFKACFPKDPIGVVPDLKKNQIHLLDFHVL